MRRVTLLAKEGLTEKRKLFVPASAKLVYHATLTERGPWWTEIGANVDVKQRMQRKSKFAEHRWKTQLLHPYIRSKDTCGIRNQPGRAHRLSKPTPQPLGQSFPTILRRVPVSLSHHSFVITNLCPQILPVNCALPAHGRVTRCLYTGSCFCAMRMPRKRRVLKRHGCRKNRTRKETLVAKRSRRATISTTNQVKGLHCRISPPCTLSQSGSGNSSSS